MHTSGAPSVVTGYRDFDHADHAAVKLPMLVNWTGGCDRLVGKASAFERWWP
jgi:hypothetical protein